MRLSSSLEACERNPSVLSSSRQRQLRLRAGLVSVAAVAAVAAIPRPVRATPSTTFWAPSTTYVQPFGVPHLTYDTYFWKNAAYPVTTGITIGVLPFQKLQLEIGYDLLLPSNPVLFLLNAKLGTPEDTFFAGSPSLSVGIFGVGIKGKSASDDGTSWDLLHGMVQKTLPWGGYLAVGGYLGLGTQELWQGDDGKPHRAGFMGGIASPDINLDLPGLKKLSVVADLQTGNNIYGAAGGGVYFYFNDYIDILTGPVYFFDRTHQPGRDRWMWTVQLDVDIPLKGASSPGAPPPASTPAEPPAATPPPPAPAGPPARRDKQRETEDERDRREG